jgi:hypothetical protein
VIASGASDNAAGGLLGAEMGHLVIRPTQLEAEDRLQILTFQQHLIV